MSHSLAAHAAMTSPAASGTLWVDRHLHKNGGSTLREVMLRSEEAGHCLYYGYTQTREGWDRLVREMRTLNGSSSALPRLCVEAHASQASAEFASHRIPDLVGLRSHFAKLAVPVRVVLTTRVREPLSYYLSFYRWRVAGMQEHGNVIRLSPTRQVVQPIGSTFLEWAPKNLQSIGLYHGDVELFAGLKAGGWPGVRDAALHRRPHPYWSAHHRFERADYRALLSSLKHYDVVAPLESFDEHLLMVSDATGIPPLQQEEHRAVAPAPQARMTARSLADAAVCPDMDKCRAHIAAIAPWDLKLYRYVQRAFGERVQALGPGFAARLAAFRAARSRGEGICEGRGCCCVDRVPCFNLTGRDSRDLAPPACAPGTRAIQRVVASDMPLGRCCVSRPARAPAGRRRRRREEKRRGRAGRKK